MTDSTDAVPMPERKRSRSISEMICEVCDGGPGNDCACTCPEGLFADALAKPPDRVTERDRLFLLRERLNFEALETMDRRNRQYATPEEPIRNYVLAGEVSSTPTPKVALARATEKLVRMGQALDQQRLDVVEEEAREIMNMVAIVAYAAGVR